MVSIYLLSILGSHTVFTMEPWDRVNIDTSSRGRLPWAVVYNFELLGGQDSDAYVEALSDWMIQANASFNAALTLNNEFEAKCAAVKVTKKLFSIQTSLSEYLEDN